MLELRASKKTGGPHGDAMSRHLPEAMAERRAAIDPDAP